MPSSWFTKYSPFRSFPPYTGPYAVGTCDVELPSAELDSPTPLPPPGDTIGTVAFRIFYPCEPSESTRPVRWVPSPQRRYGAAFARFMGAAPAFAEFIGRFPRPVYMTEIPALRNGKLLEPQECSRWPVMIFSHGLGGSRNAYSHLLGSIASHGVVVIAPDHRDCSAPISFVRETAQTKAKHMHYQRMAHTATDDVFSARDNQLRIRLWELGLIHDAVLKMDDGMAPENLDPNSVQKGKRTEILGGFKGKLDVQRPGSIIWSGHSFGAATAYQLMKSTYWRPSGEIDGYKPLFEPSQSSSIVKQITSHSVSVLLDMWCLPLRSPFTRWLWDHPMPCYNTCDFPAGGKTQLSILSQGFYEWEGNFNDTKRAVTTKQQLDPELRQTPYFFYPSTAAHLSQSDIGILYPWITGTMLKIKNPERLLNLNVRAVLQVLRENSFKVAGTVLEESSPSKTGVQGTEAQGADSSKAGSDQDWRILSPEGGVAGWNYVDVGSVTAHQGEHVEDNYQSPKKGMDEADVLDLQQRNA